MNPKEYSSGNLEILDTELIPKKWGYERAVVNDALGYCGKILTVLPIRVASSVHFHKEKTETFHVIKGNLNLALYELVSPDSRVNGTTIKDFSNEPHKFTLCTGQTLRLPPFLAHRFWVDEEVAEFIEFSTPDRPTDSYRLIESGPIPPEGLKHELY